MAVNPDKAMATIDSILVKIDNISIKEYDDDKTVIEFGELVMEVKSFIRNSGLKNLKEHDWYQDYCEFLGWTRKGVPVHNWDEVFEETELRKSTVGERYDFHIKQLKNILYGCKKEFEMIKALQKNKSHSKMNQKKKNSVFPKIRITLKEVLIGIIIGIIGSVIGGLILVFF